MPALESGQLALATEDSLQDAADKGESKAAHGVSGSAGLAQHVLESLQPDPSPYVQSLSPRRFLPRTWDWQSSRDQAEQVYENYYSLPPRRSAPRPAATGPDGTEGVPA